jgi:DNA-binding NarL/FixJ family response regulator
MFRILIVEDDRGTSGKLQARLSRKIPEAQVDVAPTVKRAQQFIQEARDEKETYDAFVLDIKLPQDVGEYPVFDESLCRTIKAAMPKAIVAHISSYFHDKPVQDHVRRVHDEQIDRSFRLSKDATGWFNTLEEKLKSFLYSLDVEAQLDQLFGSSEAPEFESRGRRDRVSYERSVTHDLAGLSRDISARWKYLDKGLQERIETIFEVTKDGDGVIVSLF